MTDSRGVRRSMTRIGVFLVALCVAATVAVTHTPSAAALSTTVVISQVYGGGGNVGAPYRNDYVELFNRGATTASLTGWSIQYASATGTGLFSANVTPLSGSLAPGQYYLVQLSSGGAAGSALPTPDAIGTTAMSATGGKVILASTTTGLACNGGSTPCTPAQLALIVDLVGWGAANFYEGPGAAPATTNSTAVLRNGGGCMETDSNVADFAAGAPAPRNTASPLNPCAVAPSVTTQPTDTTVCAGQTAGFTAAASGSPAPTVQWQVSSDGGLTWSDLPGATSATLSFTAAASQSGNRYRAVFSNGSGTATTDAATLTVNTPPQITSQPADLTVDDGQTAGFTAAASGSPAPTVQWQVSSDGGLTWSDLPGATSATLSFTAAASQSGNRYQAVFSNTCASTTSNAATLMVRLPAVVISQVYGGGGNVGATLKNDFIELFNRSSSTVSLSGWSVQYASTVGVTWFKTDLSGTIPPHGYYLVQEAQGAGGTVDLPTPDAVGTITIHQSVGKVVLVASQTLIPTGTSCPAGPGVADKVGYGTGTNCFEGTGPTGSISNTTAALRRGAGCVDTDDNASDFRVATPDPRNTSSPVNPCAPPTVSTDPVDQTVSAGSDATFTAAATGTPEITVQWQVSSDGGLTWSDLPGATSATLSFTAAASQSGNRYRAVFSNDLGQATSASATLTVDTPPQITTQPADTTVCAGQTAGFTAAASGSPAPTLQWQVSSDGGLTWSDLPGATSATLSFTAAASQSGNRYRAVFSNGSGTATTDAATLTVNTPPQITSQPADLTVDDGQTAGFTAAASGSPAPTVQWQVSSDGGLTWSDLPGATSATLSFTAAASQSGNRYQAVFSNTCASTRSRAATLTVRQMALLPPELPDAQLGVLYRQSLLVRNGARPYTFMVAAGALPPGMSLSSTGVLSGAPTRVGVFAFTIAVRDANGRSTSRSYELAVRYQFTGLCPGTWDKPQAVNAQAGTILKMVFSLGGYHGPDIFASGMPASQQISCSTLAPIGPLKPLPTCALSPLYFYSPVTKTYNYLWVTNPSWAGTCRAFVMTLKDGTTHTVYVRFTLPTCPSRP